MRRMCVCVCVCVCVYNRYFVRKEHCEPKFLTEYWVELNSSLDQCRLVDGLKLLVYEASSS